MGASLPAATAFQYEVGFKSSLNDSLTLTASAYRIVRDNVTIADPQNRGFNVIGGEITYDGIEVELAGELSEDCNISVGASLMDPRWTKSNEFAFLQVGDRTPGSTTCNVGGVVSYEVQEGTLKGLRFGGSGRYTCDRHFPNWGDVKFDSFTTLDGFVEYSFDNGFKAQLHVQNLFDSRFIETGQGLSFNYRGNGRNATIVLTKDF